MSKGVDIRSISVGNHEEGRTSLIINLSVASEDEFDAIAWVVAMLDENKEEKGG